MTSMFMRANARCAHQPRPPRSGGVRALADLDSDNLSPLNGMMRGYHDGRPSAHNRRFRARRLARVQIGGTQPTVFGVLLGGGMTPSRATRTLDSLQIPRSSTPWRVLIRSKRQKRPTPEYQVVQNTCSESLGRRSVRNAPASTTSRSPPALCPSHRHCSLYGRVGEFLRQLDAPPNICGSQDTLISRAVIEGPRPCHRPIIRATQNAPT
jgi:hypothetical protein